MQVPLSHGPRFLREQTEAALITYLLDYIYTQLLSQQNRQKQTKAKSFQNKAAPRRLTDSAWTVPSANMQRTSRMLH